MILSRNSAIYAAELDGEVCLFNPESAEYLNLNATGSWIWNLLGAPLDLDELVQALQEHFSVDPDTCRLETQRFVDEALQKGMLAPTQLV